ncbi:MAG: TIGR03087 family PEP-CTERM/XrtA system glycosyltransferase [Planctomycetaceae bacterium]
MKPRILYITHRVPWPPDRGDRIRTWNILKFLASGADVDLACLADEPVTSETRRALQGVTRQLAIIPHSGVLRYVRGAVSLLKGRTVTEGLFSNAQLRLVIDDWTRHTAYDAAISSSSGVAGYALPPVARIKGHVWVDLIDVDSQKWLDYAASASFPRSLIYRTEGRRLRSLETRLAGQADRLLVVSEAERQLFSDFCPNAPVQAVGNGVDIEYFAAAPGTAAEPHSCVFVGVMNYLPNVDAVRWFAKDVWPAIRQRFPDARFNIVGKSPSSEVRELSRLPGIHVTGAVDDVRPWLHQANCVVVPLRIARGVQNKVLEAMACGRPVVCSPAPLKGLGAEPGLHLLRADTSDDWVSEVSRVFEDRTLAADLGIAADAWVQLNHRWENSLHALTELFDGSRSSIPHGLETI